MEDEVLERNKNLNRGFRKLRVWREAIELYVFENEIRFWAWEINKPNDQNAPNETMQQLFVYLQVVCSTLILLNP